MCLCVPARALANWLVDRTWVTPSRVVAVPAFETTRLRIVGCTLVALAAGPAIGLIGWGYPDLFNLMTVVGYRANLRGCLALLDSIASGCGPTFLFALNVRHVHNVGQYFLMFSCAASWCYLLGVLWRANGEDSDRSHTLMSLTRFRNTFLLIYGNFSMLLLILNGLLLQLYFLQKVVRLLLNHYVMLADLGSLLGVPSWRNPLRKVTLWDSTRPNSLSKSQHVLYLNILQILFYGSLCLLLVMTGREAWV